MLLGRSLRRSASLIAAMCGLFLTGCSDPGYVPTPVYPDGALIGPNGPMPIGAWEVVKKEGVIDGGDYYNTGGSWYISLDDSAFLKAQATQVYLNKDLEHPNLFGWFLFKEFRVSDRFLYIEDPARAYNGFGYVVFVYTKYKGG